MQTQHITELPQADTWLITLIATICCNVQQAVTLPASWYTSPQVLQLEKQHVLYNTWQVGEAADLEP
jgi:hypothetical protein